MLIPGRNPVLEALESPFPTRVLHVQQDLKPDPKIANILQIASQKHIRVQEQSLSKLTQMAEGEPHQGVIADTTLEAISLKPDHIIQNPGLYIYIREAQYEHNVGAIIRTAEVAGAKGVILPPELNLSPVIARVSMGAVFHLPVFHGSLFPTIKEFSKAGFGVYGIERGNETPLFDVQLQQDSLMIIGGEDHALSPQILERCDDILSIPQFGKVNSLNMSVAAGICMFEYVRQHR